LLDKTNPLGEVYHSSGNNEAAKQWYRQAIQESPDDASPLHRLADIYLSKGNEKAALDVAYQIMLLNPSHKIPEAEAWEYLAVWYDQLGRETDANRCSLNAKNLGLQRWRSPKGRRIP